MRGNRVLCRRVRMPRRPDVLRKAASIEDCLGDLPETQFRLATHCLNDAVLRPGGILVLATCSVLPAEGEDLVRRLLAWANGHGPQPGGDVPPNADDAAAAPGPPALGWVGTVSEVWVGRVGQEGVRRGGSGGGPPGGSGLGRRGE